LNKKQTKKAPVHYRTLIILFLLSCLKQVAYTQQNIDTINQKRMLQLKEEIRLRDSMKNLDRRDVIQQLLLADSDTTKEAIYTNLGFEELPDLSKFVSLKTIDFRNNYLQKIKKKHLPYSDSLHKIIVTNNEIKNFDFDLTRLLRFWIYTTINSSASPDLSKNSAT
jgi:hypothetical protein